MVQINNRRPFVLIAGLNVLEDTTINHEVADCLSAAARRLQIPFLFKASFDKANRSDLSSYRGPGLEAGLALLTQLKEKFGVSIITDVHESTQVASVAEVADMIQIPAFLSRQTDLLAAVAGAQRPVLLKKMQMMSPECALQARRKLLELGAQQVAICERGTTFGYRNLVLDFQGICELRRQEAPVVVDVSHAVQQPGALGTSTGGRGRDVPSLARAAIALGVGGLFLECHPKPHEARCDGPCALPLEGIDVLLQSLVEIDQLVKASDFVSA